MATSYRHLFVAGVEFQGLIHKGKLTLPVSVKPQSFVQIQHSVKSSFKKQKLGNSARKLTKISH